MESWKLCWNLCSLRRLKPSWSHIINLVHLGLWQFYTELNWRILWIRESYELKNFCPKCRETLRITKARIQLIPFASSRGKEWVFQKILFYEDGNVVYCLCSIWDTAQKNLMKTVFKITDFENFVERQSFLYQHQSRRDAKLNSWYSFSVFFYLNFFPSCSHYCKESVILNRFQSVMERIVKYFVILFGVDRPSCKLWLL